jgi:hypothetical protein
VPKWAALAGFGFVVLFAAGAAVYGGGAGSRPAEIAAYYASHSNRMHQLAGFGLIVAAAVLLGVFAAGIASHLDKPAYVAAVVSGTAAAALLLVANALWAASALTAELEPRVSDRPANALARRGRRLRVFRQRGCCSDPARGRGVDATIPPEVVRSRGRPSRCRTRAVVLLFPVLRLSRVGRSRRCTVTAARSVTT